MIWKLYTKFKNKSNVKNIQKTMKSKDYFFSSKENIKADELPILNTGGFGAGLLAWYLLQSVWYVNLKISLWTLVLVELVLFHLLIMCYN